MSAETEEQKQKEVEKKLNNTLTRYTDYPGLTGEKINIWKNTVFKDASALELYYFANVAHAVKLNPDTKEIWAWKDKHNKVVVTVSEVGYRVNAERHASYQGIDYGIIYDGDEFDVNFISKEVTHKRKGLQKGKPIGAWAKAFRKDMPTIISVVNIDEYSKDNSSTHNAWKTNPADMIAKVARTKALSIQFPVSGAISEFEVTERDGMHDYVDHHKGEETPEQIAAEELNNKIAEALDVWELYDGKDKQRIGETIRTLQNNKTLTIEVLQDYIDSMTTAK